MCKKFCHASETRSQHDPHLTNDINNLSKTQSVKNPTVVTDRDPRVARPSRMTAAFPRSQQLAPGRLSMSRAPPSLTRRSRTKRWSDRRFRYLSALGLTGSASASSLTTRSARRLMVRARWRWAPAAQNERVERQKGRVHRIDLALETRDLGGDAERVLGRNAPLPSAVSPLSPTRV